MDKLSRLWEGARLRRLASQGHGIGPSTSDARVLAAQELGGSKEEVSADGFELGVRPTWEQFEIGETSSDEPSESELCESPSAAWLRAPPDAVEQGPAHRA